MLEAPSVRCPVYWQIQLARQFPAKTRIRLTLFTNNTARFNETQVGIIRRSTAAAAVFARGRLFSAGTITTKNINTRMALGRAHTSATAL